MTNNIIPLLDTYEAARQASDALWLHAGESEAAANAYARAVAGEETAVDAAIAELRSLEPKLSCETARAMVVIPVYRARIRALYEKEVAT